MFDRNGKPFDAQTRRLFLKQLAAMGATTLLPLGLPVRSYASSGGINHVGFIMWEMGIRYRNGDKNSGYTVSDVGNNSDHPFAEIYSKMGNRITVFEEFVNPAKEDIHFTANAAFLTGVQTITHKSSNVGTSVDTHIAEKFGEKPVYLGKSGGGNGLSKLKDPSWADSTTTTSRSDNLVDSIIRKGGSKKLLTSTSKSAGSSSSSSAEKPSSSSNSSNAENDSKEKPAGAGRDADIDNQPRTAQQIQENTIDQKVIDQVRFDLQELMKQDNANITDVERSRLQKFQESVDLYSKANTRDSVALTDPGLGLLASSSNRINNMQRLFDDGGVPVVTVKQPSAGQQHALSHQELGKSKESTYFDNYKKHLDDVATVFGSDQQHSNKIIFVGSCMAAGKHRPGVKGFKHQIPLIMIGPPHGEGNTPRTVNLSKQFSDTNLSDIWMALMLHLNVDGVSEIGKFQKARSDGSSSKRESAVVAEVLKQLKISLGS